MSSSEEVGDWRDQKFWWCGTLSEVLVLTVFQRFWGSVTKTTVIVHSTSSRRSSPLYRLRWCAASHSPGRAHGWGASQVAHVFFSPVFWGPLLRLCFFHSPFPRASLSSGLRELGEQILHRWPEQLQIPRDFRFLTSLCLNSGSQWKHVVVQAPSPSPAVSSATIQLQLQQPMVPAIV
jgi:hypothetical protein